MSARASRLERVEEQRCSQRSLGGMDWSSDYWTTGTWARTKEEADAEVAEFMAHDTNGSIGNVLWLYPGNQPRICSYCGGGHPDDLTDLIRAGWETDSMNKSYTRYLEPPGYGEDVQILLLNIRAGGRDRPKPQYPSPVPPVKMYAAHFSLEQIVAFNAAVAAQRVGT